MKKVNYFSRLGDIFLCCETLLFGLCNFVEGEFWWTLAWFVLFAASAVVSALPQTRTTPLLKGSRANFWSSMGFLLCGCASLFVAYSYWNSESLIDFFAECAFALMCISWSAEFWYSWILVKMTPSE